MLIKARIGSVCHHMTNPDEPHPTRKAFILPRSTDFTLTVRGRTSSRLKRAGAGWVKATLGSEWSGLIDRAWATRPDPAVSARTPADAADFENTLRLVTVILAESDRYAGDQEERRP